MGAFFDHNSSSNQITCHRGVLPNLDPVGRLKMACQFAVDDDLASCDIGGGLRRFSDGKPPAIQRNRTLDDIVKA